MQPMQKRLCGKSTECKEGEHWLLSDFPHPLSTAISGPRCYLGPRTIIGSPAKTTAVRNILKCPACCNWKEIKAFAQQKVHQEHIRIIEIFQIQAKRLKLNQQKHFATYLHQDYLSVNLTLRHMRYVNCAPNIMKILMLENQGCF